MKSIRPSLIAGLLVCVLPCAPLLADDVDDAVKKVVAAGEKVSSYTADIAMQTELAMGGMTMKSDGKGTMEYLKQGDKSMMRIDIKMASIQKMGENEQKTEQAVTQISDGAFSYALTEMMGQKQAVKTKYDPKNSGVATKEFFEELKKTHTITVAEEKHDGKDCYLFTATPKEASASPMGGGAQKIHVAKESGLTTQMQSFTPDNKLFMTMTFTGIKMGASIPAERFQFKAPEGVEVMDMTNAGGESAPAADKPAAEGAKPQ